MGNQGDREGRPLSNYAWLGPLRACMVGATLAVALDHGNFYQTTRGSLHYVRVW